MVQTRSECLKGNPMLFDDHHSLWAGDSNGLHRDVQQIARSRMQSLLRQSRQLNIQGLEEADVHPSKVDDYPHHD